MTELQGKDARKKINHIIKTFSVPFSLEEVNANITIPKNNYSNEQLINLAINFHLRNNISSAEKYYKYCVRKDIQDERVFSNYGIILKDKGKLKEAEYFTRKAIEIKPDFIDAHCNLGIILKEQGNLKEAELSIRQALHIKPNFANAHTNLGMIFKEQGKIKEAVLSLKKAIKIMPTCESHYYYASILFDKKEFDASLENLQKAKKLNDKKAAHWENAIQASIIVAELNKKKIEIEKLNDSNVQESKNSIPKNRFDKLILKREVEDKLISHLYTIKTNELNNTADGRYGKGVCSDFNLFDDISPEISKLSHDIISICKKELGINTIINSGSFFNIFVSGSGQPPHTHIKQQDSHFKLNKYKYSLVYYLDVGDQDGEDPGILKLHEPEDKILPNKGMIIIISGDRYHSVSYGGKKRRVMVGFNFYGF